MIEIDVWFLEEKITDVTLSYDRVRVRGILGEKCISHEKSRKNITSIINVHLNGIRKTSQILDEKTYVVDSE